MPQPHCVDNASCWNEPSWTDGTQEEMKKLLIWILLIAGLAACGGGASGGCDWFTGECYEPDYEQQFDYESDYDQQFEYDSDYFDSGYDDDVDQDCSDVGEEVWVGDEDPDGLDADGDGWGCEVWP